MTKTTPEQIESIDRMVKKLHGLMLNLASRWMDEKEYEDILDYQKVIATELPSTIEIVKMSKRPFGFMFKFVGGDAVYHYYVTSRTIGWKRVK